MKCCSLIHASHERVGFSRYNSSLSSFYAYSYFQDIVGEMRDLGEFLGSSIDEESLQKLSEESVSYKRGSDDLSEYIENYDEVYESLSKNPCLLEQFEEDEPKNFPLCGVYTGDEEEESQ